MKHHWVVLWSLWAGGLVRQPTVPVRVSNGLLRGEIAPDGSHVRYFGVPYATFLARFQESGPEPKWKEVFDGFEENSRCLQRFTKTWVTGNEDCLILNIYTPNNSQKKLPVMVFIHGGGFRDGSGSPFIYGPEYLVRHDVILVTMNYRLEILGFLNLGIKDASGNVGLKDQVQALKWVKKNIGAFGGDPDNVTIFGESAGGASVMYHILSPMSKGLFHRVIMQSASAISPWSFQHDPLVTAKSFAKQLGYTTDNPHEIYKIINAKASIELLKTRVPRKTGDIILSENIFVPSVETEIPGMQRFLPDTPYNLVANGKINQVPLMIGYNDAEGLMFVGKENDTTISNINFFDSLPRDLAFPNDAEKQKVGEKVKKLYIGEGLITKDKIKELSKYEGDSGIAYPVTSAVDMLTRISNYPVYAYKFCHNGWMNLMKLIFGVYLYPGATHADELFYLFKFKITLPMSFLEFDMRDKMSTMWTNFAKYGDPTPHMTETLPKKWEPIDRDDPRVLVIDKTFRTSPLWDDPLMRFWNETYSKYRRKT